MSEAILPVSGGIRIHVHAQPGAKRTEVSGFHGDSLKIRVHAPPVDGKANDELIAFLAASLKVPRGAVSLVRGEKSRTKIFEIIGVTAEDAHATLSPRL